MFECMRIDNKRDIFGIEKTRNNKYVIFKHDLELNYRISLEDLKEWNIRIIILLESGLLYLILRSISEDVSVIELVLLY